MKNLHKSYLNKIINYSYLLMDPKKSDLIDPYIAGIVIRFKDSDSVMKIFAEADCCSYSWFHFFDDSPIKLIKGKKIKSIEYLNDIDLPPSTLQEYDKNHLYQIIFDDETNCQFVLRNSSNGYYDGWIDITITSTISIHPEEKN